MQKKWIWLALLGILALGGISFIVKTSTPEAKLTRNVEKVLTSYFATPWEDKTALFSGISADASKTKETVSGYFQEKFPTELTAIGANSLGEESIFWMHWNHLEGYTVQLERFEAQKNAKDSIAFSAWVAWTGPQATQKGKILLTGKVQGDEAGRVMRVSLEPVSRDLFASLGHILLEQQEGLAAG